MAILDYAFWKCESHLSLVDQFFVPIKQIRSEQNVPEVYVGRAVLPLQPLHTRKYAFWLHRQTTHALW